MFGHARYLDQFFEQQLRKWLPSYTIGLTVGAGELTGGATGHSTSNSNSGDHNNGAAQQLQRSQHQQQQTFGDGSVVIGLKRPRPNNESSDPMLT